MDVSNMLRSCSQAFHCITCPLLKCNKLLCFDCLTKDLRWTTALVPFALQVGCSCCVVFFSIALPTNDQSPALVPSLDEFGCKHPSFGDQWSNRNFHLTVFVENWLLYSPFYSQTATKMDILCLQLRFVPVTA